jgi:hypothetical protein
MSANRRRRLPDSNLGGKRMGYYNGNFKGFEVFQDVKNTSYPSKLHTECLSLNPQRTKTN